MKKIVITGSTGLLGAHLVMHILSRGYHVVAIKRVHSDMKLFESVKLHYLEQQKDELKLLFSGIAVELDLQKLREGLLNRLSWATADILDTDALVEAFDDSITCTIHDISIVAHTSYHAVIARTADEDVIASAAVEGVVASAAVEGVVAAIACQDVIASVTCAVDIASSG